MSAIPRTTNEREEKRIRQDVARQVREALAKTGETNEAIYKRSGLGRTSFYEAVKDGLPTTAVRSLVVLADAIGYRVDVTITPRGRRK